MLVIVPSRGRPHNVKELIQIFGETRHSAELLVVIDTDDPTVNEYRALEYPVWATLTVQSRRRLGPTLNHYSTQYASSYDIIGFMGDDHRPRTQGWDAIITALQKNSVRTGIFYGNDLLQGAMLPTAVFITSDIINTLGYMCPEGMMHMYLDNVWKLWGEEMKFLHYMPSVIIEHMHPVAKKAEWDERYAEVNSGEMYSHDERAMIHYTETTLEYDVAKMRELV
jgi:hypothetical protein